jgi:hypothetical protein
MHRTWIFRSIVAIASLAVVVSAAAQTPQSESKPKDVTPAKPSGNTMRGGWEFEGHFASGSFNNGDTANGSTDTVQTGPPFFAINGHPTNAVQSWLFGDGLGLLNGVLGATGVTANRVTGLGIGLLVPTRTGGKSYGIRFGHSITSHGYGGVMIDWTQVTPTVNSDFLTRLDTSVASFGPAMQPLLASQLTGVSASRLIVLNPARQMAILGDFRINIVRIWKFTPFVTLGGGIMMPRNETSSVTITGSYHGTASNGAHFNETDHVTITFPQDASIIKMFGFGVNFRVNHWSGVRIDWRRQMMDSTITAHVETDPSHVISDAPAGTVAFSGPGFASRPVQLANGSTGITSLNFATSFDPYQSGGKQKLDLISVGYFVRF